MSITARMLQGMARRRIASGNPWIDANTEFYASFASNTNDEVIPLTGTAYGDAAIVSGSLDLDGDGDYVQFPADAAYVWASDDEKTIEFFLSINSVSDTSADGLVCTGGIAPTTGFSIHEYQGYLQMKLAGIAQFSSASQVLSTSTWYHIAIVRYFPSDTSTFLGFVNGTQVFSVAAASTLETQTAMVIGNASPPVAGRYTDGRFNDLRISNTARYTANFTPPTRTGA